jgi:hypothetical protein
MLKVLIGAVALGITTLPTAAVAQATSPQGGQMSQPSTPNSGAGIAGQPGNKNGPAAKGSGTTGAAPGSAQTGNRANAPEAAKVPGLPGSKSGPSVSPPASSTAK